MPPLLAAIALAALIAPAPAWASGVPAPSVRRALVVGIDRYAASPRWKDLEGAANDARAMAELLRTRLGYGEVTVLLDAEASRQAILDAFERVLIAPSKPGDLGVFFYAGHGSQVRNLLSPKPGGMDETFVPADGRDLRDVELGRLAERAAARGLRLTMVIDSCHSGSGTRGIGPSGRTRLARAETEHPISDGTPRPAPEKKGVLTLTATRAEQLAGEAFVDDRPHGAFTAALLDTLARSSADASADAVVVRTHALVKALHPGQDPGIEGPPSRRLAPPFTPATVGASGRPVVAVGEVRAHEVELLGGAAMGLSRGATLVRKGVGDALRLTVAEVRGLGRATAVAASPQDGSVAAVAVGDLFEVERYALASPAPLRVELGERLPLARVAAAARALGPLRASAKVHLVADPTAEDPTHTLSWSGGAWRLRGPGGAVTTLGPDVDAARVERLLAGQGLPGEREPCGRRACLFVRLPVPEEVSARLAWRATPTSPIVEAAGAAGADYLLAGRLGRQGPEYALVKSGARAVEGECAADFQLPVRGRWARAGSADEASRAARSVDDDALRIGRARAWLTLSAPQDAPDFPWRLALTSGGRSIEGGSVAPRSTITMELVRTGPRGGVRLPYVLAIDCKGAIEVAWPEPGRQPDPVPASAGDERVRVGEVQLDQTRGRYTFLLLAPREQLPSVEAITQPPVARGLPPAGTALDALLGGLGRTRRLDPTPGDFAVSRTSFLSGP